MNRMDEIETEFMKKDIPDFRVGDTVKVSVKIKEGDKTRIQIFEGTVIAKRGSGPREAFTVRRISYGEGVERVFQLHSPLIGDILVVKRGKVKRSKLYYLREKVGKRIKVEEKKVFDKKEDASLGKESVS